MPGATVSLTWMGRASSFLLKIRRPEVSSSVSGPPGPLVFYPFHAEQFACPVSIFTRLLSLPLTLTLTLPLTLTPLLHITAEPGV